MSGQSYYGAARARRSLAHFALGKVASAGIGVVYLVWLVRSAAPVDYGVYAALTALIEVVYLVTGLGLSTMAQRYVAEFRMLAPHTQFVAFVRGLITRRAASSVVGVGLLALAWPVATQALAIAPAAGLAGWIALWFMAGCGSRYLDELFPALMLHGASQVMALLGNLFRLAAILGLAWALRAPDLATLVHIEAVVACCQLVLGLAWFRWRLRVDVHGAPEGAAPHRNHEMSAVAWRFFWVQVMGQAWGPNAGRLLLTRLAGPAQAAVFGFAQSLVDLIRNYLPAYLLASWVRPLMVSSYVASRRIDTALDLAGAVIKLSLLMLAPAMAMVAVHGDALARWISHGRYGQGAGGLLLALFSLLLLQSVHLCLTMLSTTVERATANVQATAACMLAMPLAWLLWLPLGMVAVPVAMCVAEVAWIAWVMLGLRRAGFAVAFDLAGMVKIALAGSAGALLLWAGPRPEGPMLVLLALAVVALVLAVCSWLRPLTAGERAMLARVVPERLLRL